jgi:hypothetical protein
MRPCKKASRCARDTYRIILIDSINWNEVSVLSEITGGTFRASLKMPGVKQNISAICLLRIAQIAGLTRSLMTRSSFFLAMLAAYGVVLVSSGIHPKLASG